MEKLYRGAMSSGKGNDIEIYEQIGKIIWKNYIVEP